MDKIEVILKDPSVHFWVKDTIRIMIKKDPVDNLRNVALLLHVAKLLN